MPTLWPIEDGRDCAVPAVVRSAVVPLIGARPALGVPPFFDAMDPADIDAFTWDWSAVAFPGDLIVAAAITCTPPVMVVGTIVIFGQTVQAILGPVTGGQQTVDLNCAVTFASGRVLDWRGTFGVSCLNVRKDTIMRRVFCLMPLIAFASVLAFCADAQDTIVVPAVPTGVSQIQSWVMTIVGSVVAVFVPLIAMWLRSYIASQNALANKNMALADKNMTNQVVVHAAHLADLTMTGQNLTINDVSNPQSPVMLSALDYVNQSRAVSGVAEPQPGDDHTAQAVVAEIHKLQSARSGNEPPSIVLSPVSAIK